MIFGLSEHQFAAFAIIIAMLALFIWDKFRYDLVATLCLLAATVLGVVPAEKAFNGFSNPVIIIIASVLIISKAISRSGILNAAMRRILKDAQSPSLQVGILTACVTFLSAFMKNVGTLGIFMPIAVQVARRSKRSPSIYLMPLAFGSLIGGTMTLIGTSPNLLISTVRQELGREPFRLFDFMWVGLPLSCMAVAFLSVGWRLLPKDRTAAPGSEDAFEIDKYTADLRIPKESPLAGKRVGELERFNDIEALVRAVTREGGNHYMPHRNWILYPDDIVTVQAESAAIKLLTEQGKLQFVGAKELEKNEGKRDELAVVEAIVAADSILINHSPRSINLRSTFDVNLLAISRAGHNRHLHLQTQRFEVGDVVALQGWQKELPATLTELGLLPLADRGLGLGQSQQGLVSLGILLAAMVLISTHLVSVPIGFFGAAVLIVLLKQLSLKEAYESIEGPLIVMLAALIPIGEGLKETGATDVIAHLLAVAGSHLPGYLALALMLAVSMLLTPFLHHAAAVLVLGPVAAIVAKSLNYDMDPFLMAVALGCACDFLTPIGHQNNLLVMAPGGYRFTDYWRLGLPLSIAVIVVGTFLIQATWPLHPLG
ncbi:MULTISPECIES: SLC13 family permease [Rhodopseudomonas]|uniref:Permease n=1 Tax=Rhodopseudomonas palustris TaxID=1076 RepID=A0A0D7ELP3_RHOPL|nr:MULTISPECIES: SLC13 family permease [Rhodopseudomonas]KIZ40377.1 permease [Rhodopseudomonas palustris]MDF3810665.1 SLC13 family permease [Rhodopseudomonas sp. BAL398]WOK18458.1 SLC13 family permease [Rhodopseudomonas sp. BAL398]